jgi:hypothetical protein
MMLQVSLFGSVSPKQRKGSPLAAPSINDADGNRQPRHMADVLTMRFWTMWMISACAWPVHYRWPVVKFDGHNTSQG